MNSIILYIYTMKTFGKLGMLLLTFHNIFNTITTFFMDTAAKTVNNFIENDQMGLLTLRQNPTMLTHQRSDCLP